MLSAGHWRRRKGRGAEGNTSISVVVDGRVSGTHHEKGHGLGWWAGRQLRGSRRVRFWESQVRGGLEAGVLSTATAGPFLGVGSQRSRGHRVLCKRAQREDGGQGESTHERKTQ